MKIAYVMDERPGLIDRALADFAARLERLGVRTCGTVQFNSETPGGGKCDMDVRVLPEGPMIRISQSLGPHARGCRLDAAALEEAVALTTARLDRGADIVIVNKFGKHEAEGRGFRHLIAEALSRDIPVVVGLNPLNRHAFSAFTGDLARQVAVDCQALVDWFEAPALLRGRAVRPAYSSQGA